MSNYWRRRETLHLAKMLKDEKKYEREIDKIYRNMLDSAQKEIEAFYGRYADKEGISLSEAHKRVSKLDIEAYERKAAECVKNKDFSPQANAEMRLYNLTMKVNRLEMLKANIGLELIQGGFHLEQFMSEILQGRTMEELERQAGILGKTIKDNKKLAHAIVNQSWHNATFSNRVWFHMAQMRGDIGKLLENGMIQGKNSRVLAKELYQYYMGNPTLKNGKAGAVYAAERLMRTELARVQTEAQKQSFEKNGFSQYRFIVNGGCCDKCRAIASHNAGVYDLKDMMPGENAPPAHPHCRCSTAAYEDSNEYEAWLDYLDKGGTTISWNEYRKNGGPLVLSDKNGKPVQSPNANDDFVPAKTIEEAEKYAKQFVVDKTWSGNGEVSYKGMSLEHANTVNKTLKGLYDKFDIPKLDNIKPMNFRANKWKGSELAPAAYNSAMSGDLFFNPRILKNPKTLAGYFEEGRNAYKYCADNIDKFTGKDRKTIETYLKSGRSLVADDAENKIRALILHEMGHHIQNQIMYKDKDAIEIVNNGLDEYSGKISGYATKTGGEYIAESFCAFMNGESSKIDPKLKEYFERLIK